MAVPICLFFFSYLCCQQNINAFSYIYLHLQGKAETLLSTLERCLAVLEIPYRLTTQEKLHNGFGAALVVPSVWLMQINGIVCFVFIHHSGWLHYTPQWCTSSYRRLVRRPSSGVTLEQCKQLCPRCAAIEYWSGKDKWCYECLDHTKRTSFTHTSDQGYPPHVYIRQ